MPRGRTKKYDEYTKCEFQPCSNRVINNNKCSIHDYQFKRYGEMWEQGIRREAVKKGVHYSETMTCNTCKQTKHWKKFVLGLDKTNQGTSECRDCYRQRILPKPVSNNAEQRKKELLEYVMNQASKGAKNSN